MIFILQPKVRLKPGDKRVINRFVIWRKIGNELRVFHWSRIVQIYEEYINVDGNGYESDCYHWKDVSWAD